MIPINEMTIRSSRCVKPRRRTGRGVCMAPRKALSGPLGMNICITLWGNDLASYQAVSRHPRLCKELRVLHCFRATATFPTHLGPFRHLPRSPAMRIAKLGVVGAGTMGSGIAALAASAGIPVVLLDIPGPEGDRNAPAKGGLERARKARPAAFMDAARAGLISIGNLDDSLGLLADCDLILEAIIEQPAPKQALYGRLEALLKETAIIASNTSGIPMRILTEGRTDRFKRHFLGMHFFNPPRYLHLLELIPTTDTAPEALDAARRFSEIVLGKGIVLAKDVPGFVANRLGVYGMVAAMKELMESDLTIDEVDALTGPLLGRAKSATFRTADITGLDVLLHVSKGLSASTGEDFSMPEWVEKLAASGRLGEKTQAGFYKKVGKDITTLDRKSLEYGPQQKIDDPALAGLSKELLYKRLVMATKLPGKYGEFVRN